MANTQGNRAMWGRRRQDAPPAGDDEAIRRTDAATADIIEGNGTMTGDDADQREDPAPSASAIAEERALQLVANISTAAQAELRSLREQLDDLIRDIGERRGALTEGIRAHAEFAEAAIQHKVIIGESIAKLRNDFEKSRTPLPPVRNL